MIPVPLGTKAAVCRCFLIFRVIRDHSSRKRKLIFGETILWRTWVVNFVVKNGFKSQVWRLIKSVSICAHLWLKNFPPSFPHRLLLPIQFQQPPVDFQQRLLALCGGQRASLLRRGDGLLKPPGLRIGGAQGADHDDFLIPG